MSEQRCIVDGSEELSGLRSEWSFLPLDFKRSHVTERQPLTEMIQITEKTEEYRDRLKLHKTEPRSHINHPHPASLCIFCLL